MTVSGARKRERERERERVGRAQSKGNESFMEMSGAEDDDVGDRSERERGTQLLPCCDEEEANLSAKEGVKWRCRSTQGRLIFALLGVG